jgi:FixJ family two-component response regulator
VEDDDSMREAITRLLRVAGLDPVPYPSAEELLSAAAPGASCIVSDLRLPGMSGLDLLAVLRLRGDRVSMILVTAHDGPGLREEAERCGVADYLPKPFLGTELLRRVRAVIAGRPPVTFKEVST